MREQEGQGEGEQNGNGCLKSAYEVVAEHRKKTIAAVTTVHLGGGAALYGCTDEIVAATACSSKAVLATSCCCIFSLILCVPVFNLLERKYGPQEEEELDPQAVQQQEDRLNYFARGLEQNHINQQRTQMLINFGILPADNTRNPEPWQTCAQMAARNLSPGQVFTEEQLSELVKNAKTKSSELVKNDKTSSSEQKGR